MITITITTQVKMAKKIGVWNNGLWCFFFIKKNTHCGTSWATFGHFWLGRGKNTGMRNLNENFSKRFAKENLNTSNEHSFPCVEMAGSMSWAVTPPKRFQGPFSARKTAWEEMGGTRGGMVGWSGSVLAKRGEVAQRWQWWW